ncbi:amino acid adenylation domain-containing protein [Pseudomonas cremoricolorata]|uniref:amino acid adenylation domain-containing protein n=1 Tax=Pseudomonas cremoricolorata TaxID=157783 RepID=UPI000675F17F|nr:non-ribosomal peptide synthetase [Pseudomonas cremoricolorata]
MDNSAAMGIARRFLSLPLEKRRPFLAKMLEQGVSPANLPIPSLRHDLASVPLSFAQERQWFLWQLDPASSAYHVPTALRLRGSLDVAALQQAFDHQLQRHESLRTRFVLGAQRPEQLIDDTCRVDIEQHSAALDDDALKAWVDSRIMQPFDLQQGPVLRVSLLRLAADEHVLLLVQHHIVCDGQSMQVMVDELVQLYAAFAQGREPVLGDLPIQYADYAIWQRRWMEAGERERQLHYWQAQLGGDQPVLELPFDRPRPAIQSDHGALLDIALDAELGGALKTLAQREGVTLFMLLLATFQVLLHRHSGQRDIRVGVPVANRNRVETQGLIGFFINTQVLRAEIDPTQPFSQLLQQVRQRTLGAQAHQDLPFEQLVEALQPQRSLSHAPLFQAMFNHQHAARSAASGGASDALQVTPLAWSSHTTQFDLTLDTYESATGLSASLTYATDLFDAATALRLGQRWVNLLRGLVDDPHQRIDALPLLDEQERTQLHACNQSHRHYPLEQGYVRLFEAGVDADPQRVIATCTGQRWSYAELDDKANRLAQRLLQAGVALDQAVALLAERDLPLLAMMIGTFKAGAGYLPLDPGLPEQRLRHILALSKAPVLVCTRACQAQAQALLHDLPTPVQVVVWEDTQGLAAERPGIYSGPQNLAYIIYTSGSTGLPKGVMVEQAGMLNNQLSKAPYLALDGRDVIAQTASQSFDISVWQFLAGPLFGTPVDIVPKAIANDPHALLEHVRQRRISVLESVPSLIQGMLVEHHGELPHLRWLLPTGEAMPPELARQWLLRYPQAQLINAYGPAECSDDVAFYRVDLASTERSYLPIGTATDNNRLYLLDDALQLVPLGVVGELCVAGTGVGRGYVADPLRTAQAFIAHPFGAPGERLYRTGDLARQRADGVLEYVGRVDHQVKIRGLRIELGEIETRLLELPAVQDAVVAAQPGPRGLQLVAYYVARDAHPEAAAMRESIRAHLRQWLPEYMVPAHLLGLDRLPLNANGKVDRKALPLPQPSVEQRQYLAPQTPLQQRIAAIWQQVLKLEQVSIDDNFFELGGDSIVSIQVVSRAAAAGIHFSPRELFQHQTVQALAQVAREQSSGLAPAPSSVPRDWCENLAAAPGVMTPAHFPLASLTAAQLEALPLAAEQIQTLYPLSPMQQGMLFHTLQSSEAGLYVTQTSVPVEGLDNQRFVAAWNQIIARHEMLRTAFWHDSQLNEPLQIVLREVLLPVRLLDWRGQPVSEQRLRAEAQADCAQGFDLLRPPLINLTLIRLDDDRQQLIWTAHHILMDGWSSSQLLAEVFALYAGHVLPAKQGHYQDYIQWLQAQDGAALERFWSARLQEPVTTQLAGALQDRPAPESTGHQALYLDWDAPRTQTLREQAQRLRVTPNTLIQGAWLLLLQAYTGQTRVCFGATVAGRPTSLPNAGDILGLFINTLPIIQRPDPQQPLQQWLRQLQADNLEVRDHEHASLSDLQRWAGQPGQALFDSIIVFENYPISERLDDAQSSQLRFGQAHGRDVTNYPMDLEVRLGECLQIEFMFLRSHFTEQAVAAIRGEFEGLLQNMLDNPDMAVGNLALWRASPLPAASAAQPPSTPLVERIARHTRLQPDQPAVRCAGQQLTYAQLDAQANRLAHYLIAQGIGPEDFVGIALERSVEVIVAFLAVMKAGAAYVPLDIDYPQERLAWAMRDSAMRLLITRAAVRERLPQDSEVPCADLQTLDLDAWPASPPTPRACGDNLAYLIYTSGSTGQPKGVAVSHASLAMHCQAINELYEMGPATCELLFMSFAFDGAQERWLSTLAAGGCLVLRDHCLWTPEQTWQVLHQEQVTIACFPPAYLQQLAEFGESQPTPPPVHIYCFGGDAVADANFEQVKRALRPRYLTNGYGPTETVVTPLLWKADLSQRCEAVYAPIGRAVGQRTLQVLDPLLRTLPSHLAGELYIGGFGVARGYHGRPGLTAERFVPDPCGVPGSRLYRTGDLVRSRADGVFDYLGRLDNQVKIRGFRIELGEIEARLRSYRGVKDAVVIARETAAGKQLVGYVVGTDLLVDTLRGQLAVELPDYMVPTHLQCLAELPLNPAGKVDRKALPAPREQAAAQVAPRNLLEQQLVAIWQEVLEREHVGITDNFFELGGDSLRVLRVLSKVRALNAPGFELKLRDLMGKPTIAELSGFDAEAAIQAPGPLVPLNRATSGTPPLYCIHAGFGTLFDYEPLARHLEGRRSVIGLQCRMLLDRRWQDQSLPQMAADYVAAIRTQQPQGPYALLGWSLGGALAILMAEVLKDQGQEVQYLGLVDSFVPDGQRSQSTGRHQDLAQFLGVILERPVAELPLLALDDAQAHVTLERLIRDEQAKGPDTARYSGFEAADLAQVFIVAMRLKQLSEALQQLPICYAPATLWWASETALDERQRLEHRLQGRLQRHTLDAGHHQLLDLPEFLEQLLEEVASPALLER